MFKVIFVNLSADAKTAAPELGSSRPVMLEKEDLAKILATFSELDPVQNFEAEPQLIVDGGEGRFTVHTGQKKLFLYNTRQISAPALTLPIPELIAEIDGTAEEARRIHFASMAPFPTEETSVPLPTPAAPATPANVKRLYGLGIVASVLAAFFVYLLLPTDDFGGPTTTAITDPTELFSARASVIGVYMTGSEPGHQGIALTLDGSLKLFQLNQSTAPSLLFGRYELGKRGANICLSTDQPGGTIDFLDHDTLVYCGIVFKRIQ